MHASFVLKHICVRESGEHWFRSWLVAYLAPSHYLNQCWVIINWTPRNKLQWIFSLVKIQNLSFTKMHPKLLSAKWLPFCSEGNELIELTTHDKRWTMAPLQWRHNDHDGVSNHQPHGYLLNRLFRRRSKKTSKFRVTGLCVGNSPGPVNSPHKGSVTRKMFSFDDVIMHVYWFEVTSARAEIMQRRGYGNLNSPFHRDISKSNLLLTAAFVWPAVGFIVAFT